MRRQDLEKGAVRVFFVSFFTIFAAHFYRGTWNRLAKTLVVAEAKKPKLSRGKTVNVKVANAT